MGEGGFAVRRYLLAGSGWLEQQMGLADANWAMSLP